ncbi:MAG: 16S rRNA (cytosine(1402)-N(4))-methyltransferase RsmH [Patescibacteria group bacterium]
MERTHNPVLLSEVLRELDLSANDTIVDATFGGGGHTRALLEATQPNGIVFAFDRDPQAIAAAASLARVHPFNANFDAMEKLIRRDYPKAVINGVLFDFGISSLQLADSSLGLSFQSDVPLDMRLDRSGAMTAATYLNGVSEVELADAIFAYGEERASRRIAKAIVLARRQAKLETTGQLVRIIETVLPRRGRLHPATKTFQAIRIVVNDELGAIARGITAARNLLTVGGRIVAISFHSLEDRIVKNTFRAAAMECSCPKGASCSCPNGRWRLLTKKPIVPSRTEQKQNPRARSAKLRVIEKIV